MKPSSFPSIVGALVFVLLIPASFSNAAVLDRLEASVNAGAILKSDLDRFRKNVGLRAQIDPLFAGTIVAERGPAATSEQILGFLIDEQIILQQFPVTDQETEQEIQSIQVGNRMDRAALRQKLQTEGFNFEDYFEIIRASLAKRNLIDRDIRSKVAISDEDVKAHYMATVGKGGSVQTAYQLRILTVSPGQFKKPTLAREVIERARKALKAGESFEEVARRFSDDPSSSNGGDLGRLTSDQMSPAILNAVRAMKVGETSSVLGDSKSRFFILKLIDIGPADDSRFTQIKEELRSQLAMAEYKRQVELWLDRQRQNAFIHRAKPFQGSTTPSSPNPS
jgi:parvulin-like peptidyl-prolyl isomerase